MTIEYISREEWGAGPLRKGHITPHSNYKRLAIHHTVMWMKDYDGDGFLNGDRDDVIRYMQQLQTARPDLGSEVPYSFVVFYGADEYSAIIAEGRGWGATGAHTENYNSKVYGIAYAGDFTNVAPTRGMESAVRWLGAQLHDPMGALSTIGHRDTKATACPGNSTSLDRLQPPFSPTYEHTDPEEDMPKQVMIQPSPGHPLEGSWWVAEGLYRSWIPDSGTVDFFKFVNVDYNKETGAPYVVPNAYFDMLLPLYVNPADPRHGLGLVQFLQQAATGRFDEKPVTVTTVPVDSNAIQEALKNMRWGVVQ